ncbi:MAG: hypothetical protein OEU54_02020 [Gemmatimonadota bacterium]|nr:hypothetical protein [Gemmatimonadota bacterium]
MSHSARAEAGADPISVKRQLGLQRRILETLAGREDEIRGLRRSVDEDVDSAGAAEVSGPRDALRERWLAEKVRVVECEERIAELERELGSVGRGAAAPGIADLDRPYAACTIVCRNYLAHARALLESLAAAEPTVRRYLLVLDGDVEEGEVDSGVEVVSPGRLAVPDFAGMSFKYGVVEFNTAVKPYLLSLLFEEYGEEEVVYFDPDILVMRRLDELRIALARADIVLTPHITRPIPEDGLTPTEPDIMVSGAYNLGFIALRHTAEARRFLGWWERRLEDGCRIDVANGLFTDQKWIDLVPGLFPGTEVLRDPAYNVAFWNLHEREVRVGEEGFEINGRPAGFIHISGFNPQRPDILSRHQTRTTVSAGSGLASLLEQYADRLKRLGWDAAHLEQYGYDRFADGLRIHPLFRKLYLALPVDARARFTDPLTELGPGGFRDWATRPRPEAGGLSHFLQEIYDARVDLQDAFPDVRGRDLAHFLEWARTQGPLEMSYDASLVQGPEEADAETDAAAPLEDPEPAIEHGEARRYGALVDRIRGLADETLPAGATVAVVSRGDYRLMHLGGRQAWHFPRTEAGLYAGYHPRTSQDAIQHLETLRADGADFLLFPATATWWLDYYEDFRVHLDGRYELVVDDPTVCLAYSLTGSDPHDRATSGREVSQ